MIRSLASRHRTRLITVGVVALVGVLGLPPPHLRGQSGGQSPGQLPGQLPGQAIDEKLATTLEDLAASVAQEQVNGQVAAIRPFDMSQMSQAPAPVRDAARSRRLRIDDAGDVQVYILAASITDELLSQLADAGVAIEVVDADANRVQARVPVTRLRQVAALPSVSFVRLPSYAVSRVGAVTSEGDAILSADVARQQFGLDGAGVRVAVISDGIKGVFASGCVSCGGLTGGPMATGDLPASTGSRLRSGVLVSATGGVRAQSYRSDHDLEGRPSPPCAFAGAGAEGTALLEIVHDMAPGADLAFANAGTSLEFAKAVSAMAIGNDVVIDDLGFFGEAYDGTSAVSRNTATALNNPANRIRAYVTSVGNAADDHYFGAFVDSHIDGSTVTGISNPGRLHLFQRSAETTDVLGLGDRPYNLISLPTGGEVVIFLNWDDVAGQSATNYDLYLVRESTNTVVARSTDVQRGSQDPLEALDYTNTGAAGFFRIVIQNVRDQA
ncbi:MAG: hypothetical protein ABI652_07170, partial [Acidobacteriota bacterium]